MPAAAMATTGLVNKKKMKSPSATEASETSPEKPPRIPRIVEFEPVTRAYCLDAKELGDRATEGLSSILLNIIDEYSADLFPRKRRADLISFTASQVLRLKRTTASNINAEDNWFFVSPRPDWRESKIGLAG
jgi:hypothetical protein